MINAWFWLFLLVGLFGRAFSGKSISIALGLVVGVLVSEVWKFVLYYANSHWRP